MTAAAAVVVVVVVVALLVDVVKVGNKPKNLQMTNTRISD